MCSIARAAVVCGVCCCSLVAVIVGVGIWCAQVGGALAHTISDVEKCVKDTISADLAGSEVHHGPCGQMQADDCGFENESKVCSEPQAKCACFVVDFLLNSSATDELDACCDKIQSFHAPFPLFASLVNSSTSACHNVTKTAAEQLEKAHDNCTKGIPPAHGASFSPTDGLAMDLAAIRPVGLARHAEAMDLAAIRPAGPAMDLAAIRPVGLARHAAFGLLCASAAPAALLAAGLGLRRRLRAGGASAREALAPLLADAEAACGPCFRS